jgi:hypothetical protein
MGELFDVQVKKRDRGVLEACGKERRGDKVFQGCVVFNVIDGKPVAIESVGDPRVQDQLADTIRKRIRVI